MSTVVTLHTIARDGKDNGDPTDPATFLTVSDNVPLRREAKDGYVATRERVTLAFGGMRVEIVADELQDALRRCTRAR